MVSLNQISIYLLIDEYEKIQIYILSYDLCTKKGAKAPF